MGKEAEKQERVQRTEVAYFQSPLLAAHKGRINDKIEKELLHLRGGGKYMLKYYFFLKKISLEVLCK